jgi:hypothetical protein
MALVVVGFQLLIHVNGQLLKALAPIVVTAAGMVTDDSTEHNWKALGPIEVTVVGIVTDANDEHP